MWDSSAAMQSPVVKQTWAVSGVLFNMLGHGMVLSYPSSLLPALQAPDSDIKIDLHIASWLASVVGLAGTFGFLTTSFLMDWRGRKQTHLLAMIAGTLAWLLIYFATNVTLLMIGRVLSGYSVGATVFLGAVVIGEYSCPKHRGIYLNLKTAASCLGTLISHILCNFVHWRTLALISMIPFLISFTVNCTWPESPAWLASRKEYHKSEVAFYRLRGRSDESQKELNELLRAQKEKPVATKRNVYVRMVHFLKKFSRKDFIKPITILVLCGVLIETSGRHVFPSYALQIVKEVTGDGYETFYCTLAIDIIITISATSSSVLVKYYKRRSILFVTGFSAMCVIFSLCIYLYLVSKNIIINNYPSVSIALFVIYFILANLGCTPIPIALLGELLPLAHRGAGSAVAGFMMSLCVMGSLKITPYLLNSFKVYGTFASFGITMGLTLLILYYILPETKDRTLQEIEDYFNYGRFADEKRVGSDEDKDVEFNMIR